ncbi:MAG: hypothetical protein ACYTFM_08625 [Planctomycetota bacterium]|jgi:hypothetical protein
MNCIKLILKYSTLLLVLLIYFSITQANSQELNKLKISNSKTNNQVVTVGSEWLKAKLYGSDNAVAALRKVNIYSNDGTLRVFITNQFEFDCELKLDSKGRPHILSYCISKAEPQPICNPDRPDSTCAQSSGCFQKLPEKNPSCYYEWQVKEPEIRLKCIRTKTEDICRGTYTLKSSDDDSGFKEEMTIAKRRNKSNTLN